MANLSMGSDTQTTPDAMNMGSDIDMAEYDGIANTHNQKKSSNDNDQTMETLKTVGKVALTAAVLL